MSTPNTQAAPKSRTVTITGNLTRPVELMDPTAASPLTAILQVRDLTGLHNLVFPHPTAYMLAHSLNTGDRVSFTGTEQVIRGVNPDGSVGSTTIVALTPEGAGLA